MNYKTTYWRRAGMNVNPLNFRTYATVKLDNAILALGQFGRTVIMGAHTLFTRIATSAGNVMRSMKSALTRAGYRVTSIVKTVVKGVRGILTKVAAIPGRMKEAYKDVKMRRIYNKQAGHTNTTYDRNYNDDQVIRQKHGKISSAMGKAYDKYRDTTWKLANKIWPSRRVKESSSKYITKAKIKLANTPTKVVDGAIRGAAVSTVYGVGKLAAYGIGSLNSKEDEE